MWKAWRLLPLAFAALLSCAGADGAAGPQGPQGPTGPQGPVGPTGASGSSNFFITQGVIGSSGGASIALPSTVTNANLPVVECYVTNSLSSPVAWLRIATGATSASATCAVVVSGSSVSVVLINIPMGYFYYISATWR